MNKNNNNTLKINDNILELIIFKKLATDRCFAHAFLTIGSKDIFSNKYFEQLYQWQEYYYKKYPDTGKCLSVTQMKSMLKSDETALMSILESVDKIEVDEYDENMLVHNIDEFVRNRKLDNSALYIIEQSTKGKQYDLARIRDYMDDAFHSSLIMDLGLDYFNKLNERFDKKAEEVLDVVKIGIKAIGENLIDTNGGLAPKTLTVVNGQSNVGKSIVLGNIAINAWKTKKNVVIVTCEMSEDAYATRIDSAISKIDNRELLDKKDSVITALEKEHNIRKSNGIWIKEFPTSQLSPAKLRSYLTQLRTKFDFDLVVVDYVNIMVSDRATSSDNSYARVKQIAEDLRGIACLFNIPIVTATQLNRSGYNNGAPGMENTAESMGLVVTADVMIGIWQEKEDKLNGKLNGILMKNRYGPNDVFFEMGIDYSTLRIVPEFERYVNPGQLEMEKKKELTNNSLGATYNIADI